MPLRMSALVVIHPDAVTGLLGMLVVTHVNEEGILEKIEFLDFVHHPADVVIGRIHDGGIGFSGRVLHVLERFGEFLRSLLGVMRNIQGKIKKFGMLVI